MQILCIGDVVGNNGCDFLRRTLPAFKRTKGIDVVIANGENSSDGNGITPASANHLLDSGVDIITTGNHTYRRREFYDYIDESDCVIRPANFPPEAPGKGMTVLDLGRTQIAVINLMGNVYLDEHLACPFRTLDTLLKTPDLPKSASWIFTRKPPAKSARSAIMQTAASPPCSARTHTCRRPMKPFCRRAPATSPTSA